MLSLLVLLIGVILVQPSVAMGLPLLDRTDSQRTRVERADDENFLELLQLSEQCLFRDARILMSSQKRPIFALAVVWAYRTGNNPFYHNESVLEAIVKGGDALSGTQNEKGEWEFRTKHGSISGSFLNPWTYFDWIRAYEIVQNVLPDQTKNAWKRSLTTGFDRIATSILPKAQPHNIPAMYATALLVAGNVFDNRAWREQAHAFMKRVLDAQNSQGYWSEHSGPLVSYNLVYCDAVGIYYAHTKDETARKCLERAAQFHDRFIYPDDSLVETIDERNYYDSRKLTYRIGFLFTKAGRSLIRKLRIRSGDKNMYYAVAANILLYTKYVNDFAASPTTDSIQDFRYVTPDGKALVIHAKPWFYVVSAYVAPVSTSRFILDRQNHFSIFHDRKGLIVGGGNTKLQPLWSSITVGDTSLFQYENSPKPNFIPPKGLQHVASHASLSIGDKGKSSAVTLQYMDSSFIIGFSPMDENTFRIEYSRKPPYREPSQINITVIPNVSEPLLSETGQSRVLDGNNLFWSHDEIGDWIEHRGVRYYLPGQATVRWPVMPYNQYSLEGRADIKDARLVIQIPFSPTQNDYSIVIRVR